MPDESAPFGRVTLLTICFPPEDLRPKTVVLHAVGGTKPDGSGARTALKVTGDPAIVRLQLKPLRPVVLRPHLSAGLPLNSLHTMRWMRHPCKALFSAHQQQGFGMFNGLRG